MSAANPRAGVVAVCLLIVTIYIYIYIFLAVISYLFLLLSFSFCFSVYLFVYITSLKAALRLSLFSRELLFCLFSLPFHCISPLLATPYIPFFAAVAAAAGAVV